MKASPDKHKDPHLADLLNTVAASKAPIDLVDKLMLTIEASALRRKRVRKNLRIAMSGVASTLALMLTWLVGGNAWVEEIVPQTIISQTALSSALMLSITALGMIALFVELELVVRYWCQWRRLELKA
ncbi:MAG: hypothetical protein AB8H47_27895 [Bacteroidia bacterium]